MLALPQNLALFVESGIVGHDKPSFLTQKDLFDAYPIVRSRQQIKDFGIPNSRLGAILEKWRFPAISGGLRKFGVYSELV